MFLDWALSIISVASVCLSVLSTMTMYYDVEEFKLKGTTGAKNPLTYIAMIMNSGLGIFFGVFIADGTVASVNSINFLLMCYFCYKFQEFTPDRPGFGRLAMFGALITFLIISLLAIIPKANHVMYLGIATNALTVLMFAAPLSNIYSIISSKDASSLSFPFIILNVASCFSWSVYGILVANIFISIPSILGLAACFAQLILFVLYDHGSTSLDKAI